MGCLWTVFLKLTAAPQKKRRPRKRFTLVQTSWLYIWICRSSEPAPALGPSACGASALPARQSRLGMYIPAGCGSYVRCRYARSICMHARQSRDQKGTQFTNAEARETGKFTIDLNGKTCHPVRDPPSTLVRAVCWLACSGHDHGAFLGISEALVCCLSLVDPKGLWFKEDLTRAKYYLNHLQNNYVEPRV